MILFFSINSEGALGKRVCIVIFVWVRDGYFGEILNTLSHYYLRYADMSSWLRSESYQDSGLSLNLWKKGSLEMDKQKRWS